MDADAWRALDPAPIIYFTVITRRAGVDLDAVSGASGSVCDSWGELDLEPFGFRLFAAEPWFFRPAGPLPPGAKPAELEVVRVTTPEEVEEFEAVSARGFGSEEATVEVGSVHPASILGDTRMTNWIGRVEGRPVAAAMSYRADEAVGIFGVTTVASARARGYGTAMTSAALLVETGLPAVLDPSPMAESMYERLGFRRVGDLQKWAPS